MTSGIAAFINGVLVTLGLWGFTTATVASQFLSLFIWPFSRTKYYDYLAHLMRQWSQNLFMLMSIFSPGDMYFTFDKSCVLDDQEDNVTEDNLGSEVERLFQRNDKGQVVGISFPERLIMIANHQIYCDWIYIWFIGYLSKANGALKIMLKHSLSRVPIYGMVIHLSRKKKMISGMRFFEFIFLKRKIEDDKDTIINNLKKSMKFNRPMWLVLFPEGTVISDHTRLKSQQYAEKLNMEDFKFTLLPRTTGLTLCRETLGDSIEWIYDLTIAYPGIDIGKNPEDVMTMKRVFCEKNGPHQIHVYVRRYRLDSIPSDPKGFQDWLFECWREKDERLVYYNKHGKLPEETALVDATKPLNGSNKTIVVPIQLQHPVRECLTYLLYILLYIPLILCIAFVFQSIYTTFSSS